VNERPRSDPRPAVAVRGVLQRFASAGLVMTAVSLLLLGKVDAVLMERFRSAVSDTVAPLLDALATPTEAVGGTIAGVYDLVTLREENSRLREDRELMLRWQAMALRLEAENAALRKLLNLVPEPGARYVTARVIADPGGTFAQSLLVNGGRADGIGIGHAVLSSDGVVGRIVGVAEHSARILMITDLNSRIPVVVMPSGARGVLAGDNTQRPRLLHTGADVRVAPGDQVLTSGDGGAFPPGLRLGIVATVEEGGIAVVPHVSRDRVSYVEVVDFGLAGILGSRIEGGGASEPDTTTGSGRRRMASTR
jgi:rod shape-determining protein MreC